MGRDLSWYIIPTTLEHESAKPLCLKLDFEPEKDHKGDLLYAHFHPEGIDEYDLKGIENLELSYLYETDKNTEWCSLCNLYMSGLCYSEVVLDNYGLHHSYSNPIWGSDWNIKGFCMGSSTTPFIRKFDREHMYREITPANVASVVDQLDALGDPVRTSDKEAQQETMEVLRFLQKWAGRGDVRMIMCDEL